MAVGFLPGLTGRLQSDGGDGVRLPHGPSPAVGWGPKVLSGKLQKRRTPGPKPHSPEQRAGTSAPGRRGQVGAGSGASHGRGERGARLRPGAAVLCAPSHRQGPRQPPTVQPSPKRRGVVQPERARGSAALTEEVVHHLGGVVRGGGDPQQLLPPGHRRVVDGLDVDVVSAHELVTDFCVLSSVCHLGLETTGGQARAGRTSGRSGRRTTVRGGAVPAGAAQARGQGRRRCRSRRGAHATREARFRSLPPRLQARVGTVVAQGPQLTPAGLRPRA